MICLCFAHSLFKKGNDEKKAVSEYSKTALFSIDKMLSILSQLKAVDSI